MAVQRRSTFGIIGRVAVIIGVLFVVHVTANLVDWWAWGDPYTNKSWTYWFAGTDIYSGGWAEVAQIYALAVFVLVIALVAAVVAAIALYAIITGADALYRWVVYKGEPRADTHCKDEACSCVEHKGRVFIGADGEGKWEYPKKKTNTFDFVFFGVLFVVFVVIFRLIG